MYTSFKPLFGAQRSAPLSESGVVEVLAPRRGALHKVCVALLMGVGAVFSFMLPVDFAASNTVKAAVGLLGVAGLVPVHELIHFALFRVFGARPQLGRVGISAATTAPGYCLRGWQYVLVRTAPGVLLTAAGVGLAYVPGPVSLIAVVVIPVNIGCSLYDFQVAAGVLRRPLNASWEDTEVAAVRHA